MTLLGSRFGVQSDPLEELHVLVQELLDDGEYLFTRTCSDPFTSSITSFNSFTSEVLTATFGSAGASALFFSPSVSFGEEALH